MPPLYEGSISALIKSLYAGTLPSLWGNIFRTSYITGAKTNAQEVNIPSSVIKGIYLAGLSFGEVALTQIPNALADLKKRISCL